VLYSLVYKISPLHITHQAEHKTHPKEKSPFGRLTNPPTLSASSTPQISETTFRQILSL
jgi:hypothetical protein